MREEGIEGRMPEDCFGTALFYRTDSTDLFHAEYAELSAESVKTCFCDICGKQIQRIMMS
jgi:hypothetical protein